MLTPPAPVSSLAAKHNIGLDLTGKVAVVAGGTQGIGGAIAERLASAGSSVYIIGRNAELGDALVEKMKAKSGSAEGKTYEFIKADLSLMSSVKQVAKELEQKTGSHGVDFLIETQGKTPTGTLSTNSEGREAHFALQCLSRFGLAYSLAKSNTLKESLLFVCAPNGSSGTAPDVDDLELLKQKDAFRMKALVAMAMRDSNVMDGITAQFHESYPKLKTFHVFPGMVTSSLARNAGFPGPIVFLFELAAPIISRTFGNTPASYAEIPVYLATNPKYDKQQGLDFSNQKLQAIPPKWTAEQPEVRKALWDKMIELGDF